MVCYPNVIPLLIVTYGLHSRDICNSEGDDHKLPGKEASTVAFLLEG